MSDEKILRMCLEPSLLKSALSGQHNFINLLAEVAQIARFRVEYHPISDARQDREGVYTLTHMKHPSTRNGLVFRRVYHYPFWQIEQTAERWHWDVARGVFDPETVPLEEARKFASFWKRRLFGDGPSEATQSGAIFVPLQGRLNQHRSFQSCSPMEMLALTLQHSAGRQVNATLHPKEHYSASELSMLEQMVQAHANLSLSKGGMQAQLQSCDFVVTQNSSAAFAGYFFGKPALLFGRIDFHHIAEPADLEDLAGSFARVAQARPDFDRYLWWFWQGQCINAGKENARDRIAARFRRFGWPM